MNVTTAQALVDALAAELGDPVGLDDSRLRPIAYSPHDDVRRRRILGRAIPERAARWLLSQGIGSATGPVRIARNDDLGIAARVCVPVRLEDTLLGYLWLIDEPPADDRALDATSRSAERLRDELLRLYDAERRATDRQEELVRELLTGAGDAAEAADACRRYGLAAGPRYAALVVRVAGHDDPAPRIGAALERVRRAVAPGALLHARDGDGGLVALACGDPAPHAAAIHRAVRASFRDRRVVVGVSTERARASELRAAHREAADAARLAARDGVHLWEPSDRLIR